MAQMHLNQFDDFFTIRFDDFYKWKGLKKSSLFYIYIYIYTHTRILRITRAIRHGVTKKKY